MGRGCWKASSQVVRVSGEVRDDWGGGDGLAIVAVRWVDDVEKVEV